jgi:hypothetical protein
MSVRKALLMVTPSSSPKTRRSKPQFGRLRYLGTVSIAQCGYILLAYPSVFAGLIIFYIAFGQWAAYGGTILAHRLHGVSLMPARGEPRGTVQLNVS